MSKIHKILPLAIVVCISCKKEVVKTSPWITCSWLQFVWLAVRKVSHLHSKTKVVFMPFNLTFWALLLSLGSNPHMHTPPHSAVQYSFIDKAPAVCFTLLNSLSAVPLHLLTESASDYGVLILQPHAALSRVHPCRFPQRPQETYSLSAIMHSITLLHPSWPYCFRHGCWLQVFSWGVPRQTWCRSTQAFHC